MSAVGTPSIANASFAAQATPRKIALSRDGKELHIALESGDEVTLHAERLRAACRCAHCRRAQIDGVFPAAFPSVTIDRFSPLGHYAINIVFSDGHERGIFPWSYLAGLAAESPRA